MITPEIPEELIEAGAMAMFALEQCDKRQQQDVRGNWVARLDDSDRLGYRQLARVALSAVYDDIRREAFEEAAREIEGVGISDAPEAASVVRSLAGRKTP